ncbi:MAG TPA: HAD-IA family hydrolase [Jatrophihabitantaceae bacterium]|nr:HAD-IA family hydrolase [Jatrophihabitantaceae bacterium]
MTVLPCRGILFDCDGVLVDSDESVMTAWGRWADDLGLDRDSVTSIVHGRRSEDSVAELLPEPQWAEAIELIDKYEIEDAASVRAIPGAVELVNSMPAGLWAVVTSGTYELATARLRAAGFALPAVLVTAEDVSRGKPDPEGYLAAAARLGLTPADALVLEDAQAGIDAGRAAGVSAVVGVGREDLHADVLVSDLTAVRWIDAGLAVTTV